MKAEPAFPTAVPLYRQAEVLRITDEQALEGFFYFSRTRGEKADKYPDYVLARKAASLTLQRLAGVAAIVGEECCETWLTAMEERAQEIKSKGRAA